MTKTACTQIQHKGEEHKEKSVPYTVDERKQRSDQAAHCSVKCLQLAWHPFRPIALNSADSPGPLCPDPFMPVLCQPANSRTNCLCCPAKLNHHNSCFYTQPKETDFSIWNLISDYSWQLWQELPTVYQKKNCTWHNMELGVTYREEKQQITLLLLS